MHVTSNLNFESQPKFNKNNFTNSNLPYNSVKKIKKFSIFLVIEGIAYLEKSIESFINQSIGFENIELILIDRLCNDTSKRICSTYQEKYSNIYLYFDETRKHSTIFNKLIKNLTGKYLNFSTSENILEINALSEIYDFFEENIGKIDFISVPIAFEGEFNKNVFKNKIISNKIIDLNKYSNYNFNSFSSLFFKTELLYNIQFDLRFNLIDDLHFFHMFLSKHNLMGKFSGTKCYCMNKSLDLNDFNKKYHINKFKIYFEEFFQDFNMESPNCDLMKYWVLYRIQPIFNINNNLNFFNDCELSILKGYLYKILQIIDDKFILNQESLDKNLKYSMLIFKHGKIDTLVNEEQNTVEKFVNGNRIDGLDFHWLYIDSIEVSNNHLYLLGFLRSYFNSSEIKIQALLSDNMNDFFKCWENFFNSNKLLFIKKEFLNDSGRFTQKQLRDCLKKDEYSMFSREWKKSNFKCSCYLKNSFFDGNKEGNIDIDDKLSIDLIKSDFLNMSCANNERYISIYNSFLNYFMDINAKIYEAMEVHYPSRERKYLDLNYISFFNFEFDLPLNVSENSIILIRVSYNSLKFFLKINFQDYAKLSNESFYSNKDQKYLIKFENNYFSITNFSITQLLNFEKSNIEYLKSKIESNLEIIDFRKLYYFSFFKFIDKKIWLFIDRLDFADDNAEHLYRYAITKDDGIEKYFVISKDSKDYQRLKPLGNIVAAGSIQHKLLSCHAEKVISSQVDNEFINPFHGEDEKYYNGLFSPKLYFLQHGITLHDVSSWLHKYDKFLYLIVSASRFEYGSFFDDKTQYNYDKSVVQLLGFPRYDNLKKLEDNHEIIIMPTWRRHLHDVSDENFKKSSFYEHYNTLINDEKLISFLDKYGYKLTFKPHYNLNKYIHLFDKHHLVNFDNSRTYNEIFNHASLLITDFSSVSFDFAYLKKPVIYYHFNDEYHFDTNESYFKYDSMGFGEIVENNDDIVNLIIEYVNSNCEMEYKYKERVDNFFEFNDKLNCKRVYEFILNYSGDFMNNENNGICESKVYYEMLSLKSENDELKELLNNWGDIAHNYSKINDNQKLEIISLKKTNNDLVDENLKLKEMIEQKIISLKKTNNDLVDENSNLKKIQQDIFSSNSWKATKIFRDVRNLFKKR